MNEPLDVNELKAEWQRAKDEDYPHVALFASRHFEQLLVEIERLRAAQDDGQLRALIARWRNEAAMKDSFHATMGIGWKACADDLEKLLAVETEP